MAVQTGFFHMDSDDKNSKNGFSELADLASEISEVDTAVDDLINNILKKYEGSNTLQLMPYFGIEYDAGIYIYNGNKYDNLEDALIQADSDRDRFQQNEASGNTANSNKLSSSQDPQGIAPVTSSYLANQTRKERKGRKSGWKYIFGIIIGLFIVWLANNGGQIKKKAPHVPPYSSQNYNIQKAGNTPEVQIKRTNQHTGLKFDKPSIGTNNVLSIPQIQWCLREGIRINTMRDIIDTNEGIDEFNRIVRNYNSRCGSYRYRRGSRKSAEQQVEAYRERIVSEATRDAKKINGSYKLIYPSQSSVVPTNNSINSSDPQKIREAQQLLKELGYDPGPIDGKYGSKTASAIKSFQHDIGFVEDGKIDQNLLFVLREIIKRQKAKF